jgi:hypothetical protein
MDHCFNTKVAKKYNVTKAILLNNIAHWQKINMLNERNFHDGHYWTFNSATAFQELFDYLSLSTIKKALYDLEHKDGVLKSGVYNKRKYDQTKWYTIVDDEILRTYEIPGQNVATASVKNSPTIPDVTPDINISTTKEDRPEHRSMSMYQVYSQHDALNKKGSSREDFREYCYLLLNYKIRTYIDFKNRFFVDEAHLDDAIVMIAERGGDALPIEHTPYTYLKSSLENEL